MKRVQKLMTLALVGCVLWGAAGSARAQASSGPSVVYVDLDKVFEEFYKTKLADGQLKE